MCSFGGYCILKWFYWIEISNHGFCNPTPLQNSVCLSTSFIHFEVIITSEWKNARWNHTSDHENLGRVTIPQHHHYKWIFFFLCHFQGPSNYAFGYSVNDEYTGEDFSHTEVRDGYTTSGEYRVALPDGRIQIVKYTADENGYHADVQYEGAAVPHPAPHPGPHPVPAGPHPLPPVPPPHPGPKPLPAPLPPAIPAPLPPAPTPIPHELPPSIGYPKALPDIKKHAPLPAKFLPTPPPKYPPTPYHPTPKYTPKPYTPTPTPKYLPKLDYHGPLKAVHLEPAVYKPKPDPYAAKLAIGGGYLG